jgi:hypothetical protein
LVNLSWRGHAAKLEDFHGCVSGRKISPAAGIGTETAIPHRRHFIAYVSRTQSAQRTEDVWSCLSRRPARPASLSHRILRGGVPKCSHCAIVGVLETREALVRATLVGMIALGQEVEGPLRGPGVFFGWPVAQPLEALPEK